MVAAQQRPALLRTRGVAPAGSLLDERGCFNPGASRAYPLVLLLARSDGRPNLQPQPTTGVSAPEPPLFCGEFEVSAFHKLLRDSATAFAQSGAPILFSALCIDIVAAARTEVADKFGGLRFLGCAQHQGLFAPA
eukprot:10541539-Lingulodinium_polyedra.AAC.1